MYRLSSFEMAGKERWTMNRSDSPNFVVNPGAGDSVSFGGLDAIYKLDQDHTSGAYAVVEHVLQPGKLGSPLHTHAHEDEVSLILEGEVGVQIGEEVLTTPIGAYVTKPRGIPHAFWNSSDHPARFVEIISPPGFEQYFTEATALLSTEGPPDFEALTRLAAKYGLTMHMERLPELMQRFGVSLGP